jgi:uncharacterized membrane protein YvlD (DUF360 family)
MTVVWAIEVLGLWLLARLLPGLVLESWDTAIWAVAAIALLNALVRPVLLLLTLPFTVLSFGLLALALNAFILLLAGRLVPGLDFTDLLTPVIAALGLAVINTFIASVLSLNEEDSVYRNIVKRIARRSAPNEDGANPGMVILEIDGLSRPVLQAAVTSGYMPYLAGWLRAGSHKLDSWDCGLPSQTSSSQAGILCGNNFDIPAFRWYEKETGRLIVTNHPSDVSEIERRVSSGEGLLSDRGCSVGNLLSGDAARSVLTMSTMLDTARTVRESAGSFYLYLLNPYHFSRALVLTVWEIVVELWQGARQLLLNVQPRVPRGGIFPLVRAISTALLREFTVYLVTAEMFSGASVIYATFVGYDVVAHHAGPARPDALRLLRDLDRRIAFMARAAEDAPRPYYFVVLSDHGQSFGATFKQRYDSTLDELVQSLLTGEQTVRAYVGKGEGFGHLNALLTRAVRYETPAGRAVRHMLRRRTHDGYVDLEYSPQDWEQDPGNVVVCASGNLGLVYFADRPERVSFESIAVDYPRLIEGLVGHPGIGFVLAYSSEHGPLVLGETGIRYLKTDRIEGTDPLVNFGENAADHLRRLDTFPHVGDLVVNGMYDPSIGEVAAFEELVGSHGGLGGPQTEPFLIHPSSWSMGAAKISSPTDLYWLLRRWRENKGTE